ncbi:2'-5' RNA ligase family protein [Georgenia halophila]|uniref:RNA 2',3'-cyclic phosphodiesterase n=1 Tax=Georgenia halophila TaxID=620889 RepID=A0ABP8L888_9MICO
MRLYVSLHLPEDVSEHLDLAVRAVTDQDPAPLPGAGRPALRWVPMGERHITLAFFGEVPAGAVDELTSDLRSAVAAFPPLPLRLRGAGVFSGRTLWVGVQEQEPRGHSESRSELVRLMADCEGVGHRNTATGGHEPVPRDRRRAHVTLARSRDRRVGDRELRRRARALSVYSGPPWTADSAHLMLSELGAGRSGTALHTPLAEVVLGGE